MKSIRWFYLACAAGFLVSATSIAQLSKGPKSGGGSPPPSKGPSNPGSGPKAPKEDKSPPPRSDQGPKGPPPRGDGGPKNPPPRSDEGPKGPPPRSDQGPKSPPPRSDGGGPKLPPIRDPGPPPRSDDRGPGGDRGPKTGGNSGANGGGLGSDRYTGPTSDQWTKGRNPRNGAYNGSVNNAATGNTRLPPITIHSLPQGGSLPSQVLNEERVRRTRNIYRSGYYHYDPYWCDDYFWSRWYIFNPYRSNCVISPWYWYPSLPGYLNYNCISIVNIPIVVWNGSYYNYRRGYGYYDNYRRGYLDSSIDDIVDAFERSDRRSLSRVIPRSGRVNIYTNGRYDYSLRADDFYDLMLDAIYNVRTRSYNVVRVETYRDEAEVVARHSFIDPWGRTNTVYHWYRLEEERNGYVITNFGTSDYNCW